MSDTTGIIETRSLTRNFKRTRAVEGLNLSIQPGELFGLVGPDGSGKTTTLRLLAGLLDITSGAGNIAGFDLADHPESIKSVIGYMAQQFSLYAELTVSENLAFFAELYDVNPKELPERTERLLGFAGLKEFQNRRAAHLSGGMQKKLALACTLIHDPPILLLDEPTTGVDPISRREFWKILSELHLKGTTIVVSTPYMDEADRCSRVGLMYAGRMVICGSPQEIRDQIEGDMLILIPADWRAAMDVIQTLPGVFEVQTYGESLHVLVDNGKLRLPQIERSLEMEGLAFRGARHSTTRMEEAFISLIQRMEN